MSTNIAIKSFLLISLWATVAVLGLGSSQGAQSLEGLNWGTRQEESCRAAIFGFIDDLRPVDPADLVIVVRILGSDGLDRQVIIKKRIGHAAFIRYILVAEKPLAEQLADVHELDPTAAPEFACQRVKTVKREYSSLPELDGAIRNLRSISVSPVLASPFIIHGNSYEIWIFSGGALSHFEFMGFGSVESGASPLQAWCDEVFHLLPTSEASDASSESVGHGSG